MQARFDRGKEQHHVIDLVTTVQKRTEERMNHNGDLSRLSLGGERNGRCYQHAGDQNCVVGQGQ